MARRIVVGIHEAKTHFSRLVRAAQAGQEVVVENRGTPVVRIVGWRSPTRERQPGLLAGRLSIARGFDELPAEFEDAFADP